MPHNGFSPSVTEQVGQKTTRTINRPTPLLPKAFRIRQDLASRSGIDHRKQKRYPGINGKSVQGPSARVLVDQLLELPRQGPSVAYLRFPYSEKRCHYCNFYGSRHSPAETERYLAALLAEIETESRRNAVRKKLLQAVYLSTGTPTILSARQFSRLLATIRHCLPLADDCEITVAGRVHGFTEEKMAVCLEAGVNRFSLGVQTFDTRIRRSLGRIDNRATLVNRLRCLNALCKTSRRQAALIIDLIYGLPGQTLNHWRQDLEQFLELELDGVHLSRLRVFPKSSLSATMASGQIVSPPTLAEQARYFAAGVRRMQTAGLQRLSLSHWGRTPLERNRYTPMVKGHCQTLAYGCAADGNLAGHAFHNARDPEQYLTLQAEEDKKPVTIITLPPPHLQAMRSIITQMEHCRLDWRRFEQDSSYQQAATLFAPLLGHWQESGLILATDSGLELTLAGQFWQPELCGLLFDWFHMHIEKRLS